MRPAFAAACATIGAVLGDQPDTDATLIKFAALESCGNHRTMPRAWPLLSSEDRDTL